MPPQRFRSWCFTDFNSINFEKVWEENKDLLRYLCRGKELCPDTKKPHQQGWMQFKKQKTMRQIKKLLNDREIHLEACRGNAEQNETYCRKDNKFYSWGKFITQGQRTDLEQLYKEITMGTTMFEIMDNHFEIYLKYRNGIRAAQQMYQNKFLRNKLRNVEVEYIYGETGTGKSMKAWMSTGSKFILHAGDGLKWFDMYNGEKTLIIDEYSNDVKINRMLAMLDIYPLKVEVKHSMIYAQWTKIIITSNLSPAELHPNAKDVHREALFRRINTITHLTHVWT